MRKSIHISSIIIPIIYYFFLREHKSIAILTMLILAVTAIIVEMLRLENRNIRKVFFSIFGIMLRKHEVYDFTGASYLLTSAIFCIAFFPPEIAFLSLSFLSIGDTFAALVGMSFGKRKFPGSKKSVEGSLACFASTFLFAILFEYFAGYPYPQLAFFGALAATIAEAWNLPVDDNVKIPIASGLVMILVYVFLP